MPHLNAYAVIGHPVKHSRSPEIHTAFAKQTGEDLIYSLLPAPRDGFVTAVSKFFSENGRGLNVTLPFKQEAAEFADHVSERARHAGAVNTLAVQDNGSILGDNTDGKGLVTDLTVNLGLNLHNKNILILGAGGAVRGVAAPLLNLKPRQLVIANRTVSKAQAIADNFKNLGPITSCGLDQPQAFGPYDLIINSISAGLSGEMPPLPEQLFAPQATAYDMIYANEPTPFLRWAQNQGARQYRDGFGMLVEQAAESFFIWRGIRPQTTQLIQTLRP